MLRSDPLALSATGMARTESSLYVACIGEKGSSVIEIDMLARSEVRRFALPETHDVHSIIVSGDSLIVASTGTDEVLRYSLSNIGIPEPLWRAGNERSDTHHLNALAVENGRFIGSAFGEKADSRWSSARRGYIFDVATSQKLFEPIYHPHSLATFGGDLFFCESSRSMLLSLGGRARKFQGYVRGLTFARDGSFVIGSSIGRTSSDRPDEVLNPADSGMPTGSCGIEIVPSFEAPTSRFIDLSAFTKEVYDVMFTDEEMGASK